MRDGKRHVYGCKCSRCEGSRHKNRARLREHRAAQAVGGYRNPGSGAWGGFDTRKGKVNVEETSNNTIVRGFKRWWGTKAVTKKLSKLFADTSKPRALVLSWDNKPQIAIMPFEDWERFLRDSKDIDPIVASIRKLLDQLEE